MRNNDSRLDRESVAAILSRINKTLEDPSNVENSEWASEDVYAWLICDPKGFIDTMKNCTPALFEQTLLLLSYPISDDITPTVIDPIIQSVEECSDRDSVISKRIIDVLRIARNDDLESIPAILSRINGTLVDPNNVENSEMANEDVYAWLICDPKGFIDTMKNCTPALFEQTLLLLSHPFSDDITQPVIDSLIQSVEECSDRDSVISKRIIDTLIIARALEDTSL